MAKKYLITYLLSLIIFSLFILSFINLIDPYYVNGSKLIKGLNVIKPEAYIHKMEAKRSLFLAKNYETLLLGNSRVDLGFNPLSENWPKQFGATFNFGIPGIRLEPTLTNYYFSVKKGRTPKRVILFVDFYNYIHFYKSEIPHIGDEYIHPWVEGHFSLSALQDSFLTIQAQYIKNPAGMNSAGFNAALPYNDIIRTEGHYNLAQETNLRAIQTYTARKASRDKSENRMTFDLSSLNKFSKDLSAAGVKLIVIFPPYHMELHKIIKQTKLTSLFLRWKESVINTVSAANTTAQIWDFALINEVTKETIPDKGDTKTKMKWFWEPGHFKASLGDIIACEVSENKCPYNIGVKVFPVTEYK